MSQWSQDEVEFITNHGNAEAEKVYLARYRDSAAPPQPNQLDRLRQWIKSKYIEQRWVQKQNRADHPTSQSKDSEPNTKNQDRSEASRRKTSSSEKGNRSSRRKSEHKRSDRKPLTAPEASGSQDLLGLSGAGKPSTVTTEDLFVFPDVVSNHFDPFSTAVVQGAATNNFFSSPTADPSPPSTQAAATLGGTSSLFDVSFSPLAGAPTVRATAVDPSTEMAAASITSPPAPSGSELEQLAATEPHSALSNWMAQNPGDSSKKHFLNVMASELAQKMVSSQRYEGDPFADVVLEHFNNSATGHLSASQEKHSFSKAHDGFAGCREPLSPSMSLQLGYGHQDSFGTKNETLRHLGNQVAALKEILEGTHIAQPQDVIQNAPGQAESHGSLLNSFDCPSLSMTPCRIPANHPAPTEPPVHAKQPPIPTGPCLLLSKPDHSVFKPPTGHTVNSVSLETPSDWANFSTVSPYTTAAPFCDLQTNPFSNNF